MSGQARRCACDFDPFSVPFLFSADWYRAHRDHHLTVFPNVDQGTRDNFEMFISMAEERVS